jgi:hypothetical protein
VWAYSLGNPHRDNAVRQSGGCLRLPLAVVAALVRLPFAFDLEAV